MATYYIQNIGMKVSRPDNGSGILYIASSPTGGSMSTNFSSTYNIGYEFRINLTDLEYQFVSVEWKDPATGTPWIISDDKRWARSTVKRKIVDNYGDSIIPNVETIAVDVNLIEYSVTQNEIGQLKDGYLLNVNGSVADVGTTYKHGAKISISNDRLNSKIIDSVSLINPTLNLIVSNNSASFTYDGTMGNIDLLFNITDHYEYRAIPDNVFNTMTDNGVTLYVDDKIAIPGDRYTVGTTFKLVAADGQKFYYLDDGIKTSVCMMNMHTQYLTLNDDETIATGTILKDGGNLLFTIDTRIIHTDPSSSGTTTQPSEIDGVNNVYQLTDIQVKQIIRKEFIEYEPGGSGISFKESPLNKFILGLIRLPFNIPVTHVIGEQNIFLGDHDTTIAAKALNTDSLIINMGTISVPTKSNNFLDYKDAIAILHLPFVDTLNVDIDYVIGQTLSVEYVISLYDSMTTVNVYSSKNNSIILTKTVDLDFNIPFGAIDTTPKNNNPHDVQAHKINSIKTPSVEIMRNEAILSEGLFTIPVIDEGVLSGQSGFVRVEEVMLSTNANTTEKDLILQSLKQGVYIK